MATPKKKTAPKTAKPKKTAKAAEPKKAAKPVDLVDTLDATNDQKAPDAPALSLAKHAEGLAGSVRALHDALSTAKVSANDADRLDTLAALLRSTEEAWQSARKETATGAVAKARGPLLTGRNDLYGALDAFVDDEKVAAELEDIGTVDDDDDLESDASRLIKLSRAHEVDLAGTEITPARVAEVEAALDAFRKARKGVKPSTSGEDAASDETKHALSEAARVALERRNRVFWSLSALDRLVCKRARFRFRSDEKRRAAFSAYATEGRRTKKPAVAPPTK